MTVKKLKYGGFSLLMTVLFLTAVILLNIFAGMLTQRFYLKADLTETGLYSLSDKAAEVLGGIEETVDVIVLAEESVWLADSSRLRTNLAEILQNYSAMSGGRIRVQYVNPDLNSFNGPAFNNSLSELKEAYAELEDMAPDDIIFLSSNRATRVAASSAYTYNYDSYSGRQVVTGIRADQELVGALLYVLSEKVARVAILEGHGESTTEYLQFLFERSGYTCLPLDLALRDIPDDTIFVVSAAPKKDFLSDEIIKLEHYLSTGGNAMIFYDYATSSLPLLDGFLAQWGVSFDNQLICDDVNSYMQPSLIGAQVVAGSLPSSAEAAEIGAPVALTLARPIRTEWAGEAWGNFAVFPLIETHSTAYAKDYSGGGLTTYERESGDENGPFTIAYDIRQTTYDANSNQVHSHLIVSSMGLIDDLFLMNYGQYFYNIMLIIGIANDLNPFGESVYIPSKQLVGEPMMVSAGQARSVLILMVAALPLLIMSVGILVWRKRRHQ